MIKYFDIVLNYFYAINLFNKTNTNISSFFFVCVDILVRPKKQNVNSKLLLILHKHNKYNFKIVLTLY